MAGIKFNGCNNIPSAIWRFLISIPRVTTTVVVVVVALCRSLAVLLWLVVVVATVELLWLLLVVRAEKLHQFMKVAIIVIR